MQTLLQLGKHTEIHFIFDEQKTVTRTLHVLQLAVNKLKSAIVPVKLKLITINRGRDSFLNVH